MKRSLLVLMYIFLGLSTSFAQEKLKVTGDAKIEGILKLNKGDNNTVIGVGAGSALNEGSSNVFLGANVGENNVSGSKNVFIGNGAGRNNTDRSDLVAIGASALFHNGLNALNEYNGTHNVAIGARALYSNTQGRENTANGFQAMQFNTTGNANTATGTNALLENTTGDLNTAHGSFALTSNKTGFGNVAVGSSALGKNRSGSQNTVVGNLSFFFNETGSNNTCLGALSEVSLDDLTNTTALGSGVTATASNKVTIGRNVAEMVIGGYANWSNLSDGRFKETIEENVPGIEFIQKLRPVTYRVNIEKLQRHITAQMPDTIAARFLPGKEEQEKAKKKIHSGFVAQEVEEIAKEIGYQFDGVNAPKNSTDSYSIAYGQFVPSLVKAAQELAEQAERQQKLITSQAKRISHIENENRQLHNELAEIKKLLERVLKNSDSSALDHINIQETVHLEQNSPNPFSESTFIDYFIPVGTGKVQLQIADMNGRVLRLETIANRGAGRFVLETQNLVKGTYTYSLLVDGRIVVSKHMVLLK